MIRVENRCMNCATEGYPCTHCGAERTPVFICDYCGEEVDRLFWYDSTQQYCEECILQNLEEVVYDG